MKSTHLTLTPAHQLHCPPSNITQAAAIHTAFSQGTAQGLLSLITLDAHMDCTPSVIFWLQFTQHYLTKRCHQTTGTGSISPIQPEHYDITQWVTNAPPMQGAEYLCEQALIDCWQRLDHWVCSTSEQLTGKFNDFLQTYAPQWRQVGRVCFHLAENKNDELYPFAFMATYAAQLSGQGKIQHLPLGQALKQYTKAQQQKQLMNILQPIQSAAETCPWINTLIESGDIYHPLAWSIEEAYRFLAQTSVYEQAGIVVKLPNWWQHRAKPQVAIKIGDQSHQKLTANHLLDFRLEMVLDGETLTEAEWQQLQTAQEPLVFLKGQWVEVDTEQLKQALTHWKKLEKQHEQGLSFTQGMRLLAGANIDLKQHQETETTSDWFFVEAGEHLQNLIAQLRSPKAIKNTQPGSTLKATLRPYQATGVTWLYQLTQLGLGACLADDMGMGKTIQIIALLLTLKKKGAKKPSLLVLPTSLLANWQTELDRFSPSLNYVTLHTSELPKASIEKMSQQGIDPKIHLVLTTYGTLPKQSWLLDLQWQLAIIDEAQAIKNPNTKQTKTIKKIQAEAKIALTGTPVENRLSDVWSLFDFICPGLLGTATEFKSFTKSLLETQQYAPLKNLIQPYILRRLKTDKTIIADLPDKTETYAYCPLSKQQATIYQKSVQALEKSIKQEEGIKRRGLVLSYLTRFKQICNHPSQLTGDNLFNPKHSGKFERLRHLCEEISARQEKVLIFTQFRELTDVLADLLTPIFGQPGLILHGGTPVKARHRRVNQFQQDDGPPFFVLSIKAGGTGLNLTAASHVIHFDRWWNPAVENQATDRAFRIGQKKNVLVHKFVCKGTIEEKIDALIQSKNALANDLLTGSKEPALTELSDQALMDMVRLDIHHV
jgi:SNF2 family DNA or RNA helicase